MTDDPLLGRRLANFQIERPLGRGGMAQVYYGQDIKLRRPVAIKVIDARYRDKPAYAERFVREAQAIATWRHENIIQIYYADDEDGFYYFVMEYIDGADLGNLLNQARARGQLLPHHEVLRIGRAVANALDYAHKKGIIHRDVKPSNVLVAQDGRVVLTDFGLALDAEMGSMGEVFGSAHYVAPEQARNSAEAVPQSDLYSLGIILYEMLTGQVPFTDASSTAVAIQHLTQPAPPPRSINPKLSQETEAVLLKALNKSPQNRYQTGRELLDALELTLAVNDPTIATPLYKQPTAIRPMPPASGRPWLYLGLAAGLGLTVLLLGVILAVIFFINRDKTPAETAVTGAVATPQAAAADSTPVTEDTANPETAQELPTDTLPSSGQAGESTPAEPTHTPGSEQAALTPLPFPSETPTPTPSPTETPTPVPVPEVLADTLTDFSTSSEGKWRYIWARPGATQWSPLRYEQRSYGACWYAQDYIRICPDSGHPGNGADIAWYWTSLSSGPIEVQITASKKDRGGDGVIIAAYHNTLSVEAEPIFQKSLGGRDNKGFSENFQINDFAPQDSLILVIRKKGDATSDHTLFHASICHYACP